jgi:hypothetical protein
MKIKVTLYGRGGELDCRTDEIRGGEDPGKVIQDAVMDLILNCVLDIGDSIKIEEIQ